MATRVKCPKCDDLVVWSPENPYRPFCSERCKLADLGAWATGQYSLTSSSPENRGTSDEGGSEGPT
jgi:endogenous inhibitor of DNA gyrase (YacG/DUF329 family)